MSEVGGSTPGNERIVALDALRGFALLGIFLANIGFFSAWVLMNHDQQLALAPAWVVESWHGIELGLIEAKFYSLFSMLFGAGFALQLDRIDRRGGQGLAVFYRRMALLLLIGLIHMIVVWLGDILTLYALMGFILPLFRKLSEKALLVLGALLVFSPLLLVPLFDAQLSEWTGRTLWAGAFGWLSEQTGTPFMGPAEWIARPDFGSYFAWHGAGPVLRLANLLDGWRFPRVLGCMLLGMAFARMLLLNGRPLPVAALRNAALGGFAIGMPFCLWFAVVGGGPNSVPAIIGTVPLAIGYGAALLLWTSRSGSRLAAALAPAGRMALTLYISQSVFGILVFTGVWGGLATKVSPSGFVPLALAFYALQLLFARHYLAHHAQGPLEKLWRLGTYAGRGKALSARPAEAA